MAEVTVVGGYQLGEPTHEERRFMLDLAAWLGVHFPARTRLEIDAEWGALRFRTGERWTQGEIMFLMGDSGAREAIVRCAIALGQRHFLQLAHDRGGYS